MRKLHIEFDVETEEYQSILLLRGMLERQIEKIFFNDVRITELNISEVQNECQPRLRLPRQPLPACVAKEIWSAVDRDARRFDCSRSWIIAVTLATYYDIDIIRPGEMKRKRGK